MRYIYAREYNNNGEIAHAVRKIKLKSLLDLMITKLNLMISLLSTLDMEDSLLRQLQSLSIGVSVNNMYAGGYLHADDIRTLANNLSSLDSQISIVTRFAADNFLTLNASKCEIVAFQRSGTTPHGSVDGDVTSFPIRDEAKCLRVSVESEPIICVYDSGTDSERQKSNLVVSMLSEGTLVQYL